jgi:hypothetical protein
MEFGPLFFGFNQRRFQRWKENNQRRFSGDQFQ